MAKQRRRFSQEFKQEAIQLASGGDLFLSQVAKDLGFHPIVLAGGAESRDGLGVKAY